MNRTSWQRCPGAFVVAASVVATLAAPRVARAEERDAASAKKHREAGARAARASRWDEALTEYQAAETASPSAEGALGVAVALDALRRDVEAYDAFRDAIAKYGSRLSGAAAANARARLAALERVTGTVRISVNVAGAAVTIDAAEVGVSPLAAPVRVPSGLHRVRATKPGYVDAEVLPTVAGGTTADATLTLTEAIRTGHVVVRTGDGAPANLLVDGVDRGPLPFDGEIDAGAHDVYARSPTRASPHQTIEVVRGQTLSLLVGVSPIKTRVHVATADRNGIIAVDGAVVGEGEFEGQLPIGEHAVRVARPGYEPVERRVFLREGESYAETFTLTPAAAVERVVSDRPFEGIKGGVMLAGAFQANGLNGDFSEPCSFASSPVATSCSAGSPAGGAIMGYVGYTVNPVGVDVLFGGQLDTTSASLTVPGHPTESFTVPRLGGFVAPRATVAGETHGFRFSFAAGVGLAVREVVLSSEGLSGLTGSDPGSTYVAPAITFEGTAHVRVSPKVAVGAGLMYWAESAGGGVTVKSGPYLTEPAVVLSAAQAMVLPFVALEYGP